MFNILGTLCTAVAVFSLLAHLFDIGLVPTAQLVVDSYRGLVHAPMEFLLSWVRLFIPSWKPPGWLLDLYGLSFLGAAAYGRGWTTFVVADLELEFPLTILAWVVGVLLTLFLGAVGIGITAAIGGIIVAPLMVFMRVLGGPQWVSSTSDPTKFKMGVSTTLAMFWGALGAALFFAINAFSPG